MAADFKPADALFNQHKYAESLDAYKRVAETSEAAGDRPSQAQALAMVARCCTLTDKLEDARSWIGRAEALASPDEPLGWSRYLIVRGIVEREAGDKPKAKATFVEAYAYCHERRLHRRALDAIHHVGIVVPPVEQVEWHQRAIAEAEALGDKAWLAVLWNNLGATYDELERYPDALSAYLKAREYHHKTGGDREKLIADWAVGRAYRLCGRFDEARPWLEQSLEWASRRYADDPSPDTAEWVGWCRKDLGELLIATGRKADGVALMKQGRASLIDAGIEKWGAELLAKIDATLESAGAAGASR